MANEEGKHHSTFGSVINSNVGNNDSNNISTISGPSSSVSSSILTEDQIPGMIDLLFETTLKLKNQMDASRQTTNKILSSANNLKFVNNRNSNNDVGPSETVNAEQTIIIGNGNTPQVVN